jgi:hypothetical protein
MNLKYACRDMAWFPLAIDVIHHQCKSIKSFTSHPQIECGYHYNNFNKGEKNMAIHGLVDHIKDYLIHELPPIWKNNPTTLVKD